MKVIYLKIMHMRMGFFTRYWIMGINFFSKYYSVFDADDQKIGFAKSILADQASNNTQINLVD